MQNGWTDRDTVWIDDSAEQMSSFLSDTLHLRSSAAIGRQLCQCCCDRSGAIPQSAVLSDDWRHGSGNGRLTLRNTPVLQ